MLSAESILKTMPEFAYVFNKHNELVLWNKNLESVLGYTEEELYKKMFLISWKKRLRTAILKP